MLLVQWYDGNDNQIDLIDESQAGDIIGPFGLANYIRVNGTLPIPYGADNFIINSVVVLPDAQTSWIQVELDDEGYIVTELWAERPENYEELGGIWKEAIIL